MLATIILSPQKIARILMLLAFLMAVFSIGGKYIEASAGVEEPHIISLVVRILNINRESSLPTWYSASLLLLAGLLNAGIHIVQKQRKGRYVGHWLGLGIIFLYLSIDEASAIHEKLTPPLQEAFQATGPFYFAWLYVGIPFALIIGLLYLRFLFHLPPHIRNGFILAGIFYIGGAVGIEMIGANKWYLDNGSSLLYSTIGTIEEFCEMTGVIALIYSLLVYLQEMQPAVTLGLGDPSEAPQGESPPDTVGENR